MLRNTSEIGLFKIVSESGTGAGVRRIEALTGKAAFLYLEDIQEKFNTMKSQLKVKSDDQVVDKLTQLQDEEKALLKQLEQRDKEITSLKMGNLRIKLKKSMAIKYWLLKWMYQMRKQFARQWTILNLNYKNTIIILASNVDDKVSMVRTVPKSLTNNVKAGDLIKQMAPIVGGKGGGRPDMIKVAVHNLKISQNH